MGKHNPNVIRYYYRGDIERSGGRTYQWHRGYSAGENAPLYPWMTRTECRADAKSQGATAKFVEEEHAHVYRGGNLQRSGPGVLRARHPHCGATSRRGPARPHSALPRGGPGGG